VTLLSHLAVWLLSTLKSSEKLLSSKIILQTKCSSLLPSKKTLEGGEKERLDC
jgi:hypothetical protein